MLIKDEHPGIPFYAANILEWGELLNTQAHVCVKFPWSASLLGYCSSFYYHYLFCKCQLSSVLSVETFYIKVH